SIRVRFKILLLRYSDPAFSDELFSPPAPARDEEEVAKLAADALARENRALFGVHLLADARSFPDVPIFSTFCKIFLVRLRRDRLRRRRVRDLHAQHILDQLAVVHPDRVVVREQRANFDADKASDAFLEAVLHRLHAAARNRAGRQVLDALHRAELGAFAAREAQVHVHERDFARALLLLSDLFGSLGDAVFLETALDDFYCAHILTVTLFQRARSSTPETETHAEKERASAIARQPDTGWKRGDKPSQSPLGTKLRRERLLVPKSSHSCFHAQTPSPEFRRKRGTTKSETLKK